MEDAATTGVADAWNALGRIAAPHAERLRRALADPGAAQRDLLSRILRANAGSDFAREHGLHADLSPSAFRGAVPVRTYDELRPWIDAIAAGRATALTGEPVIAFEETGGSTGGRKLVPYTRSTLGSFAATVLPWMADLVAHRPALTSTTAYFAVSPAPAMPGRCVGGIPVGLDGEAAYFGAAAGPIARIGVFPDPAATPGDVDGWAIATAARLVAEPALGLISVWSPTFLARILDAIEGSHEAVARAVSEGGGRSGSAHAARLAAAMGGGRAAGRRNPVAAPPGRELLGRRQRPRSGRGAATPACPGARSSRRACWRRRGRSRCRCSGAGPAYRRWRARSWSSKGPTAPCASSTS